MPRVLTIPRLLALPTLACVVIVAIACGGAADTQAEPQAQEKAADAGKMAEPAKAKEETAPVATAQSAESMSGLPGAGEKVTILVVDVQNKIMFSRLAGGPDLKYLRMIQDDLFAGGGGDVVKPGLITAWEMSPDSKTWTLTHGDDIKWHNGDTLDADDIHHSISLTIGPEALRQLDLGCLEPRSTAAVKRTKSVEMGPGPNQVTYVSNEPAPEFAFLRSQNNQDTGALVNNADHLRAIQGPGECFDAYEKDPVGTGPFKYVNHVIGQKYQLERFDDYFYTPDNGYDEDRRPKFQYLDLEIVLEGATRAAALAAGDADIIEANINMLDQINSISGSQIAWQDESSHTWFVNVDCWTEDLWCYSKPARQATIYAVDYASIAENLYGRGATLKGWTWVTANAMGYSPEIDAFPYDPEKAKQLWADAGLGEGVEITIHTWDAGDLPFLPQVAELVASAWTDVLGANVSVNVGDQQSIKAAWNNRQYAGDVLIRTNEARYDGTSITRGSYTNPDIAWRATSDSRVEPWKSIADRVHVALNDIDLETRPDSFTEVYKYLQDLSYTYGPFSSNVPWGVGPRIKKYEPWTLVPYLTGIWTIELN